MVLNQRDETKATIESLIYEVKETKTNVKKPDTDVSIVKKVNNILMKKSVDLEQQCWANAQYSLRECLEIAGITTSILQQNLEENVCQIFKT